MRAIYLKNFTKDVLIPESDIRTFTQAYAKHPLTHFKFVSGVITLNDVSNTLLATLNEVSKDLLAYQLNANDLPDNENEATLTINFDNGDSIVKQLNIMKVC